MKYMNKRNGQVATLVSKNDRFKTNQLQYEDGKVTEITDATLKRWWKLVKEEELVNDDVVEPLIDLDNPVTEEEAEALGMIGGDEAVELAVVDPDDVAGDGTPLSEVGKEIFQQAKEKAKAAKKSTGKSRSKKVMTPETEQAMNFVFGIVEAYGDEVFVPQTAINMRTFKVAGHNYVKFNYSCSSITVAVPSKCLAEGITAPDKTVNHSYDAVYVFKGTLTDQDQELIRQLVECARAYRVDKNSKKEEK